LEINDIFPISIKNSNLTAHVSWRVKVTIQYRLPKPRKMHEISSLGGTYKVMSRICKGKFVYILQYATQGNSWRDLHPHWKTCRWSTNWNRL